VNLAGGLFEGTGNVIGQVNLTGGTVKPGDSPGVLTMGNFGLNNGGTLEIDIQSLANFGQIMSSGEVRLLGALDVVFLPGYTPQAGDSFDILHTSNAIKQYGWAGFIFPTLPSGLVFSVVESGNQQDVFLDINAQAVPEPSTLLLLVTAIVALYLLRRRVAAQS
jgi:PEP-CTERM motif